MRKFIISMLMLILVVTVVMAYGNNVYANNFSVEAHETQKDTEFSKAAVTLTGIILSCLRYAGAGIAIISLVLIAMKYLYSSPGEKADYKKNLLVYTIGGLGMFSVGTILDIIQKLSEKVSGTQTPANPT